MYRQVWTFVIAGGTVLESVRRVTGNIVSSQLTFLLRPDDNLAEYQCNATNDATDEPLVAVVTLRVSCTCSLCTQSSSCTAYMRHTATNGVAFSVCLLVTTVSRAKTAEPIEMPLGMSTRVGINHVGLLVESPGCSLGKALFGGRHVSDGHVWCSAGLRWVLLMLQRLAHSRNRPTATDEKKKSLLHFDCDFSESLVGTVLGKSLKLLPPDARC